MMSVEKVFFSQEEAEAFCKDNGILTEWDGAETDDGTVIISNIERRGVVWVVLDVDKTA